ncbi:hypothetical protein D9757_001120 [Collybiopsis confluens]|uniref:Polyketide synthase n=1 Tax=Collybiopsis confluens TaxID=2823264 RepID=A0A8H5MGI0_9AGAR|nr:hypothetical protein D9757_001120 [Collybiopsis confluens]
MSGRISYAMKLSGPSVVLDTACAASVVTIYLACRALMNGDCTAALAGGVNTISSPDMTLGLDRAHFLSPTGQCKPWDISADGYSRSEGVGLFVLKKLSDAVRENDRILGIIRGVEVNHSGEAQSITHPHAPTQFALYERLLRRSGVDRGLVNVIEAHGTGTQAGDPNELEGLRRAFASSSVTGVKRTKDNPLHITSVKANIGHLEAASGSASLAKLLLMMKHRTIPRVVSLRNLNPSIKPLEDDGVCIARQNMEWVPAREGMPRVALLNNFGAAGQNAALLVEEYIAPPRKTNDVQASHSQALPLLFGASAKDKEALYRLRDRYVELLEGEEGEGVNLVDVAYTATARRQVYESRFVVTASTKEELVANLKHAVVQPNCPLSSSAKAIFMFSGQGGQYLGMGRSLYTTVPKFRKDIDLCHRTLVDMGFPGILDIIQADGSKSGLDKLVEFEAYQASVFSLQYALAQLWISWGIQPAAVVGHSIGEYAALVIAGVLDLRSALFVVASRVRLMVQKCPVETTGMLAVNMKPEDASRILSTESSVTGVTIACFNSPVDVVLGGPVEALKRLKGNFDAERLCKSVLLSVPYGYHTDAMLPITTDLNAVGDSVAFRAPKIPVVSNVTGAVVEPGNSGYFTAEYFSEHCMQPVQFTEGIQALMASPLVDTKCCIEIGPHPTTIPMLKVNPMVTERETWFAWSLRKNEDHWKTLSESLATMYMRGMPLQWRRVYEHLSPTCIELPSYPFSYSSFWVQYREYIGATPTNVPVAPVQSNNIHAYTALDKWIQYPSAENEYEAVFESSMGPLVPLITGHGVGDHPLCPASVYHEIVLSGIRLASRELEYEHEKDVTVLKSVEYLKPLVYTENDTRILRTRVTHVDTNGGSFTVSSCYPESEAETVHCSGEFQVRDSEKSATKFQRHEPILLRDIDAVCSNTGSETFSTRTVYQVIFPRVVSYSEAYHTVRKVFVHPNGYDAYAIARVDESRSPGNFIVNPIFMDTVLHVSGFVANMRADTLDALICNQVDSVKIFSEKLDLSLEYGVYTQSAWIAEENSVIADAYAIALPSRRIVGHIKGIHFRKLRLASIKRALSLSAGVSTSHHPPASLNPRPAMITSSTSIKTALNHHASVSASRHVSRAKTQTNAATLPSKNAMPSTRESDIWTAVLDIIASTCGISLSELDSNADLSALGVDSLMGIEMSSRLQASFPDSTFDARALLMLSTPAQIAQEVMSKTLSIQADGVATDSSLSGSAHLDESNIITAVATPRSTPSVLSDIHDDISVRAIIASMLELNAQEIEDDDDLESLGMDSLSAMESLDALRKATQMKLPSNLFEIHTTVRAVDKYISSMKNSTRPRPDFVTRPLQLLDSTTSGLPFGPIPVPIQRSGNDNIPLFLIHDGSGLINHYERMISIDRDVWGIYNPNFNGNEEWSDIESMATHYSKLIDETVPAGPMLIGGWSFGGVVAYEIARCLLSLGRDVQGILLIDPPSPVGHVPLSEALLQEILSRRGSGISSNAARLVRRQFKLNSGLMGRYSTKTQHDIVPVKVAFLRSQEGLSLTGTVPVPKWLANRSDVRDAVVGWEPLVRGPIEVLDIPGNHFEPFLPAHIEEVSRKIEEGCHLVTI